MLYARCDLVCICATYFAYENVIYSTYTYYLININSNFYFIFFQDNYNVLHIAAMYSREDVVKLLLNKRGVDPFSTGGVSTT